MIIEPDVKRKVKGCANDSGVALCTDNEAQIGDKTAGIQMITLSLVGSWRMDAQVGTTPISTSVQQIRIAHKGFFVHFHAIIPIMVPMRHTRSIALRDDAP